MSLFQSLKDVVEGGVVAECGAPRDVIMEAQGCCGNGYATTNGIFVVHGTESDRK